MSNRTLIAIKKDLNNKINEILKAKKKKGYRIIKQELTDDLIEIGLKVKKIWK